MLATGLFVVLVVLAMGTMGPHVICVHNETGRNADVVVSVYDRKTVEALPSGAETVVTMQSRPYHPTIDVEVVAGGHRVSAPACAYLGGLPLRIDVDIRGLPPEVVCRSERLAYFGW